MRRSEWLVLGWCAVTMALTLVRPLLPMARLRVVTRCLALAAIVRAVALTSAGDAPPVVRNLAPALYVLAAYWIAAGFFVRPNAALEAWLARSDRRWLGRWHPEVWVPRSRWRLEGLEFAYFAVYAMLPLGMWAAHAAGGDRAVDWYWSVVFPAEALAYLGLAFWQTRPPRAIEPWAAALRQRSPLRVVNEVVLDVGSHGMNTLPSGHAAGAVAVALAVATLAAPSAPVFAVVAVAICAATVVGRYHFLVDTVTGAGVALLVWVVAHVWDGAG